MSPIITKKVFEFFSVAQKISLESIVLKENLKLLIALKQNVPSIELFLFLFLFFIQGDECG